MASLQTQDNVSPRAEQFCYLFSSYDVDEEFDSSKIKVDGDDIVLQTTHEFLNLFISCETIFVTIISRNRTRVIAPGDLAWNLHMKMRKKKWSH